MNKGSKHTRSTRQKMSASHTRLFASRPYGSCKLCRSLKHTTKQHKARTARGRLKSKLWRKRVVECNRKLKTGKKASKRTRGKMSETHKRIQNLPEMRAIHSQRSKEMWARRTKAERNAIAEKSSQAQRGSCAGTRQWPTYYARDCHRALSSQGPTSLEKRNPCQ